MRAACLIKLLLVSAVFWVGSFLARRGQGTSAGGPQAGQLQPRKIPENAQVVWTSSAIRAGMICRSLRSAGGLLVNPPSWWARLARMRTGGLIWPDDLAAGRSLAVVNPVIYHRTVESEETASACLKW